jgi:hypothetical protein
MRALEPIRNGRPAAEQQTAEPGRADLAEGSEADAEPHHLHLLSWRRGAWRRGGGGVAGEGSGHALQEQVDNLFGWKPDNVMFWLPQQSERPGEGGAGGESCCWR